MTHHARADLLVAAARSVVERQQKQPDTDLTDAVAFAVVGAVEGLYPIEAQRLVAARVAFADFTDLEHSLVDVAFSVGVAYGQIKT